MVYKTYMLITYRYPPIYTILYFIILNIINKKNYVFNK